MSTPIELLYNGSIIRAGYETYNQAFAFGGVLGYPIGFLFIVFQVLLFIQNRNIAFNFVMSLLAFAVLFAWLPIIMKGVIVTILALELTGIVYLWVVKEF
jgi:hypothetical protein